jgi:hypothetical protein
MYRQPLIYISAYVTIFVSWWFSFVDGFSFHHPCLPARLIYHPSVSSSVRQICLNLALESFESINDDDEEEEDEQNPLAKGVDSVRWLPSVKEKQTLDKEDHERNVS